MQNVVSLPMNDHNHFSSSWYRTRFVDCVIFFTIFTAGHLSTKMTLSRFTLRIWFLALPLFSACTPLHDIGQPTAQAIDRHAPAFFAGQYTIKTPDLYAPSLWDIVAPYQGAWRKGNTRPTVTRDSLYIDIHPSSKDKITFTLYDEQGLVRSKTIRGKYKDGYFYSRQKMVLVPFFPMLFHYNFQRFRIRQADHHLVIHERRHSISLFFLIHVSKDNWRGQMEFASRK